MNRLFRPIASCLIAGLLSGCYVIDIQQGNIIHPEKVAQLRIGMSKEQVRYLMGSPVLESAFNDDHWDYVYTLRDTKRRIQYNHVGITFKNDHLQKIEKVK